MIARIKNAWSAGRNARRGWWGNKPPPIRQLVLAGALVSVVLVVMGLFLDQNALGLNLAFPSLTPFVWDLAKATTLGSLVVAFWDDIRSWGVRWHVLQANASAIASAVDELMDEIRETLSINGLSRGLGGEPALAAIQVREFSAWFAALENQENNHYFQHSSHSPFADIQTLQESLDQLGLPNVLLGYMPRSLCGRTSEEQEEDRRQLRAKAQRVGERIEAARLGYSTGLSAQVDSLIRDLDALAESVSLYEALFVKLADGHRRDTNLPSSHVPNCWTRFSSLARFLDILTDELETGRPHPYSDYRWKRAGTT